MAPILVSLDEGVNIVLSKPIIIVGRSPDCDVVLDSRKVSRQHCCLARRGDHLIIRDLGSANGIRINGHPVKEGVARFDDEVTIGNRLFRIVKDDSNSLPHSPSKETAIDQEGKKPTVNGIPRPLTEEEWKKRGDSTLKQRLPTALADSDTDRDEEPLPKPSPQDTIQGG